MPHKQGKIFDQAVDHDQKQGDPYIDITKAQGNPYPASAHAFNGLADHKPAAKQRRIRHERMQHKGAQSFAGKQRPDGSCPAAPGAVRSGQRMKRAGQQKFPDRNSCYSDKQKQRRENYRRAPAHNIKIPVYPSIRLKHSDLHSYLTPCYYNRRIFGCKARARFRIPNLFNCQ